LYDDSTIEEALMRRSLFAIFAATLMLGYGSASAQDGDLAGVTMRVLDDVSDIDAVILELDANRGEGDEDAQRGSARAQENAAEPDAAEDSSADDRLERQPLHQPDHDELGEGKLEDNDVEQPTAAPTP
jgi:hypothetical protein